MTAAAPPPAALPASRHVLYVDDDRTMAFLSEVCMADQGYRVTCVGSAEEALELLGACTGLRVDVLVTDFHLPGRSGPELARALAAALPELPVIVTSAHVNPMRVQEAREAGALALVEKTSDCAPLLGWLAVAQTGAGGRHRPPD